MLVAARFRRVPCLLILGVCLLPYAALGQPVGDRAGPTRHALIIGAKGGDQAQSDEVLSRVGATVQLLTKAGFAEDHIDVFCEKGAPAVPRRGEVTRKLILDHLAHLAETLSDQDELWVFLYGHANLNARGLSIRTEGARLRGSELADALERVPGRQAVFCLNRQSAALMPLLAHERRVVVTATNDPRQLNPPLFGKYLLAAWTEDPTAPLLDVLRQAGADTQEHYKSRGLVYAECAQASDGIRIRSVPLEEMDLGRLGRLRMAPPDGTVNDWALNAGEVGQVPAPGDATMSPPVGPSREPADVEPAADAARDTPPAEAPPQLLPADEQTLKLIRDAAELAKRYDGYAAFYLQDHRDYLVNADHSTKLTVSTSVYLTRDVGAESFGKVVLSDRPPVDELQVVEARIIYPDGSFTPTHPKSHGREERRRFAQL